MKHIHLILALVVMSPTALASSTNHTVNLVMKEVAILGVEPAITVTETATSNIEYTSIVSSNSTRIISVWVSSGTIPANTILSLSASTFGLQEGFSSDEIKISTTPQMLVQDIKSCATGAGTNAPNLTYVWHTNGANVPDDILLTISFLLSGGTEQRQTLRLSK